MYTVHMKRVTATEARKQWFRLLDEVAAGEEVVVIRNGVRILLSREAGQVSEKAPNYRSILKVEEKDRADLWGWNWREPGQDMNPDPDGG